MTPRPLALTALAAMALGNLLWLPVPARAFPSFTQWSHLPDWLHLQTSGQASGFRTLGRKTLLATWVWHAEDWQQDPMPLLVMAHRLGISRLYVELPMQLDEDGKRQLVNPEALARLIGAARKKQLRVWACIGDPALVLAPGQKDLLARLAAIQRYNRGAVPRAKLSGIQLDIEPHLNPGYALSRPLWHQRLLDTLRQAKLMLAETSPLEAVPEALSIEACIPFWLAGQPSDGYFGTQPIDDTLQGLTPWVDGLTVMDYSIDPATLLKRMQPYLRWGEAAHKPVAMAVELAPVGSVAGKPQEDSRISFYPHKDQLLLILNQILPSLQESPAFGGIVLHHSRELTRF